jgi:hypothetical protein
MFNHFSIYIKLNYQIITFIISQLINLKYFKSNIIQ